MESRDTTTMDGQSGADGVTWLCCVCLEYTDNETPAVTITNGHTVCRAHISAVEADETIREPAPTLARIVGTGTGFDFA